MPKVGKKEFSYSDKGKAKAKAYAEKTGQEVEYPSYDAGGRVKVYREGGEVKEMSKEQVSNKFQGTPKQIEGKMKKDKAFAIGMKKYYGTVLDKKGKLNRSK